ncbi:MAG: rhodanese-like domain-containing protein [Acidobacteriota bacterium]
MVGLATAAGILNNHVSPEGIGLTQHPLEAVSELDSSRFIRSLKDAEAKWKQGVTFVDARQEDFYWLGHIPGAISLPISDFETTFPKVQMVLPSSDREIVCYCSGFGCEESTELAERLLAFGYQRVYVFEGGWPEWSDAGLPVEASE